MTKSGSTNHRGVFEEDEARREEDVWEDDEALVYSQFEPRYIWVQGEGKSNSVERRFRSESNLKSETRTSSTSRKGHQARPRNQMMGSILACVSETDNSNSSRKLDMSFKCGCMASLPYESRCLPRLVYRKSRQMLRCPKLKKTR